MAADNMNECLPVTSLDNDKYNKNTDMMTLGILGPADETAIGPITKYNNDNHLKETLYTNNYVVISRPMLFYIVANFISTLNFGSLCLQ